MRKAFSPTGKEITHQDDRVVRRYEVIGFNDNDEPMVDVLAGGETFGDTSVFDAYVDEDGELWQQEDLTFTEM